MTTPQDALSDHDREMFAKARFAFYYADIPLSEADCRDLTEFFKSHEFFGIPNKSGIHLCHADQVIAQFVYDLPA